MSFRAGNAVEGTLNCIQRLITEIYGVTGYAIAPIEKRAAFDTHSIKGVGNPVQYGIHLDPFCVEQPVENGEDPLEAFVRSVNRLNLN